MVLPRASRKVRTPGGTQEAAFVSALIVQTIKEMRNELAPNRYSPSGNPQRSDERKIKATTWLGSKDAQRWFDLMGVDQSFALYNMGWIKHARALLDTRPTGPNDTMTEEESRLLETGIDFLTA